MDLPTEWNKILQETFCSRKPPVPPLVTARGTLASALHRRFEPILSEKLTSSVSNCFQCSTSCGLGVQSMEVKCVKKYPSGKGESVDEKECTDIKPPSYETCNVDNPCREEVKD